MTIEEATESKSLRSCGAALTAVYGKTPRGWLAAMQKKSGTGCGFAQATMVLAQEVLL